MTQWMKTLVVCMCTLTILLHLVPDGQFAKYVRFYAGLLFLLMVLSPVPELFCSGESLEQLLELQFLQEEYEDLQSASQGLSELRTEQILQAYQAELERQVSQVLEVYGMEVSFTEITFGEDGYSIEYISAAAVLPETEAETAFGEAADAAFDKAKNEIMDLYSLSATAVEILVETD